MAKNYMFLYGKNSILERLKANPASIHKILIQDSMVHPELEKLVKKNNLSLERLQSSQLSRLLPAKDLQGIVAKVDRFKYTSWDDLLPLGQNKRLTLIFLDRLNDPHNLGVIIRIAACFGKFAIAIPKFAACEVNQTVLHVASGGENYIPVAMVTNLASALIAAKKCGYWIVGTELSAEAKAIDEIDLPFPLGLLLGSEGGGIRWGLKKQIDIKAKIPMPGVGLSFNVSTACAIFCYEIAKARGKEKIL